MAAPGGDGDSIASPLLATAVVTWVIALVFVLLRFYTRTVIVRARGVEDWTILVALLFSIGVSVGTIMLTRYGWGKHVWTLSSEDFVALGKAGFAMTPFYQMSLAFTKISILFLYLRILTYRNARWIVYIVLAIVVVYNIVGFCLQMTQCVPLEKLWDPTLYGTCHPESFLWAVVGLHVSTDFIIFALPIPIISNIVTMPMRQKLILVALFGVGFFACAVSIVRAVEIKVVYYSQDYTRDFVQILHWNCVEVNLAIVCACLMTFKRLISKIWPGWLPPSSGGGLALELKEVHLDDHGKPIPLASKPSDGRLRFVSNEDISVVPSSAGQNSRLSSGRSESESSGFPAERVESCPDVEAVFWPAPVRINRTDM